MGNLKNLPQDVFTPYLEELEAARKNWGWFFALGVLLIAIGTAALAFSYATTMFSVVLLGCVLLAGGVVQIVQTIMAKKWHGQFLTLLLSLLYLITGVFCIARPAIAAIELTLIISMFCIIAGIFRMATSLISRFNQWGWVFFNGLVTLILGCLIFSEWPYSGLWIIGLFVGIDLILSGWTWVLISLKIR
jgi:uncharacterized membrane protein HdeD (DUF308 family)